MKIIKLTAVLVLFLFNTGLFADYIVELNSTDQGSFTNLGKKNYEHSTTANANNVKEEARSYYSFDLSGVTDPILSATFEFTNYSYTGAFELELRGVTSVDVATMIALPDGSQDNYSTYFNDLGSGNKYATTAGSTFFTINAQGISDLNALGGLFAFGIKNAKKNTLFSSLGAKLTLTVAPEPHEFILIALGLVMMLYLMKRNQAHSLLAEKQV